jgi:hypothetical protein
MEIIRAAGVFRPARKASKWTVIVENRELPARPLVLKAAGVAPNDPTNSHQAVAILERLGFETRYSEPVDTRKAEIAAGSKSATEIGGLDSIADAFSALARQVPGHAWAQVPADLSKNVDHYLYGREKEK